MGSRRPLIALGIFAALVAAAVMLRLTVGDDGVGWPARADVLGVRAQRAVAGLIVGGALGLAGVMLQCLLRNPLASPDLLGLASGAGLGVMIAAYTAFLAGAIAPTAIGGGIGAGALIGACAALALIYLLSQRRGLIDPVSLVLVGVVMSLMCGSGTVLVQHLMPDRGAAASRWLFGALSDDTSWRQLAVIGAAVVACLAFGVRSGPAMDAASLGEDEARSVGVNLGVLRAGLFAASGVLSACAVVLAGPVGFVGLVCPHAARMVGGPGHRWLTLNATLAGAGLVVLADAAVKSINLDAGRLPISVVTSLIGGPFFIWLLRQGQRDQM
ncbi:MAG: iron ABC transporter permease [Phycisphaerales bacterium]|nr:iron ABC transporter permease [Phycisphaerales bacterium]